LGGGIGRKGREIGREKETMYRVRKRVWEIRDSLPALSLIIL